MFEKTLNDIVRGIRANKNNENGYISDLIKEIKNELNSPSLRSVAISKLIYLHILGYDMSWASFQVVELMSSKRFNDKRKAYLAGSVAFKKDNDVILLTTNLIRKDLSLENSIAVIGTAISGLASFMNQSLAKDLFPQIMSLVSHPKAYVRKKAILLLYRVFLNCPDTLVTAYPCLKEKLKDKDSSVVSATVNLICELSRKNPRNYLALVPQLYDILINSTNNWVLIKLVKLFASMVPFEPRLVKKLQPPLISVINSSKAKSLVYECIYTLIVGGMLEHLDTIKSTLKLFLEDSDQNLKFVSLLALNKLIEKLPIGSCGMEKEILNLLDDSDLSIRLQVINMVGSLCTDNNLVQIIGRMVANLKNSLEDSYKNVLCVKIIEICQFDYFSRITDFKWYVNIIIELIKSQIEPDLISEQLIEIGLRVPEIRDYLVDKLLDLFESKVCSESFIGGCWIVCQYCSYFDDVFSIFLSSKATCQSFSVQAVIIQGIFKIYCKHKLWDRKEDITGKLMEVFGTNYGLNPDVQETLDFIINLMNCSACLQLETFSSLFSEKISPITRKAQKNVSVPSGLFLDEWINEPPRLAVVSPESPIKGMEAIKSLGNPAEPGDLKDISIESIPIVELKLDQTVPNPIKYKVIRTEEIASPTAFKEGSNEGLNAYYDLEKLSNETLEDCSKESIGVKKKRQKRKKKTDNKE